MMEQLASLFDEDDAKDVRSAREAKRTARTAGGRPSTSKGGGKRAA